MSTEIAKSEPTFFQKALLAVKHESDQEFTDLFPGDGMGKVKKMLEYLRKLEHDGYINPVKNFVQKITLTAKGETELARISKETK